jgi:hypothetical protein
LLLLLCSVVQNNVLADRKEEVKSAQRTQAMADWHSSDRGSLLGSQRRQRDA